MQTTTTQIASALSLGLCLAVASAAATAGQVMSDAELTALLGDALQLEDFEGINLAGGTNLPAPNPLNASTAPANWGIAPGVNYLSGNGLSFGGAILLGSDSIVLGGSADLLNVNRSIAMTFNVPQLAVGFYVLNNTGNLSFEDTATFYNQGTVLGSLNLSLPRAGALFAGWQDAGGVTSVRITSNQRVIVDNVTWGVAVAAVPEAGRGSLMALGGLGLWSVLRRRSQRHSPPTAR